MPKVAACQMVSTPDVDVNLLTAERLIQEAVEKGAQLVCLPEYFCLMGRNDEDKVALREPLGHGPLQDFLSRMANQHQIWLVGGTIPLATQQLNKILNSTLVFDPNGNRVAQYDKIHLFSFNKAGESYDEARTIVPGITPVSFDSPWGPVGLSVCYDLRFPELYRALSPLTLLLVPAAFTYTTGSAHWDVLLRARAIENQCYVLAAAQGGQHLNGRRTWGHSQLIDPWGEVLGLLPEGEGVVVGELDINHLKKIRENLPALTHRRLV
jgi:deaminated glutathione amidase